MKEYHKAAELLRQLADLIDDDAATTRKVWSNMDQSPMQLVCMLRADTMTRTAQSLKLAAQNMEQLHQ